MLHIANLWMQKNDPQASIMFGLKPFDWFGVGRVIQLKRENRINNNKYFPNNFDKQILLRTNFVPVFSSYYAEF